MAQQAGYALRLQCTLFVQLAQAAARPRTAKRGASAWPQRNAARVRFSGARLVTVRGGRIWGRLAGARVAEAGSRGKVKSPRALSTPAKSFAYKYCSSEP